MNIISRGQHYYAEAKISFQRTFSFFFGGGLDWKTKKKERKRNENLFRLINRSISRSEQLCFSGKEQSLWISLNWLEVFFWRTINLAHLDLLCNYELFVLFFFIYYYFTLSFRVAFYNRFCEQNRYTSLGSTWWMLKRMGDVHSVNCPIYIYIKRNTNTSRDSCCCCCCRCYYYYCCL